MDTKKIEEKSISKNNIKIIREKIERKPDNVRETGEEKTRIGSIFREIEAHGNGINLNSDASVHEQEEDVEGDEEAVELSILEAEVCAKYRFELILYIDKNKRNFP